MSAPSPPLTHFSGPTSPPFSSAASTARPAPSNASASASASDTLTTSPNDAATKLAEAIDDFLGDLEKKFKVVSDEILTKLDDMAERCDRLEQEMLLRDASGALEGKGTIGGGSTTGST